MRAEGAWHSRMRWRASSPLRLTGQRAKQTPDPGPVTTPLNGAADPRWVLALRTAELLQGSLLSPQRRERLVSMGCMLGLTAFDANLVVAIVQDRARRGIDPRHCPSAMEGQLALVSPGDPARKQTRRARIKIAWIVTAMTAAELLLIWAVMGGG